MNRESLGLSPSPKVIPLIIRLNHVEYLGVAAAQPILDHGLFYMSMDLN